MLPGADEDQIPQPSGSPAARAGLILPGAARRQALLLPLADLLLSGAKAPTLYPFLVLPGSFLSRCRRTQPISRGLDGGEPALP